MDIPVSGDRIGRLGWVANAASGTSASAAAIDAFAAENWITGSCGAYLVFGTVPIGSLTITERVRITSSGQVGIGVTPAQTLDMYAAATTRVRMAMATQSWEMGISAGTDFFYKDVTSTTYPMTVYRGTAGVGFGYDIFPSGGGLYNCGGAVNYWNDVSYKTLTDRGCLGCFDGGVELADGSLVSDVEALKSIKVRTDGKLTVYGVPMLDYASMPKAVYKPAPIAEQDIYDLSNPEAEEKVVRFKKGEKAGDDGAELTSLVSIIMGAVKELSGRIDLLESK
jgi:hypothetical protein